MAFLCPVRIKRSKKKKREQLYFNFVESVEISSSSAPHGTAKTNVPLFSSSPPPCLALPLRNLIYGLGSGHVQVPPTPHASIPSLAACGNVWPTPAPSVRPSAVLPDSPRASNYLSTPPI